VNNLKTTLIWVVVVGSAFAILWWRGQLQRLSNYIQETREELRKCSWPTRDELVGSTVLVSVTIILLGVFTGVLNVVFTNLARWLT